MEGVPYIEVSATQGGSAITWDDSNAGEALAISFWTGSQPDYHHRWNGLQRRQRWHVDNVDLINQNSICGRAGFSQGHC